MCIQQGKRESEDCAFGTSRDHRVDRFKEALQIIVPLLRTGQVYFDAWRRLMQISGTPKDRCAGPRRSSRCGRQAMSPVPRWEGRDLATLGHSASVAINFPSAQDQGGQHSSAQGEQPKLASPDEIVEMLRGYAREGLSHVQL